MRSLLSAFALVLFGCAHSSPFTSPDELKRLVASPLPAKVFAESAIDVETFALTGPFGARAHETETPWGKLLAQTAAAVHFEPDAALGCAARELAQFELKNSGAPSESLAAFMLGRCGATQEHGATRTLSGDVSESLTDQQLFDGWRSDLTLMLGQLELGDLAGLAVARGGGKAQVVMIRQKPKARLKDSSWSVDAQGNLAIEGVMELRTERVEAMINQGPLGWADCIKDDQAQLPSFRFVCKSLPSDPHAWLSVLAWEPNRILGQEVARLLVSPSGKAIDVYRKPDFARPAAATTEALVERLNEVRLSAGLPPLALAPAESSVATALVPHFFGRVDQAADKIALGLIAGWDINALVSKGTFYAGWAAQADSGALLSSMLDSPGGRRNLLDPKATLIAAGLLSEGSTLATVISTYEVLPPVDPTEVQKQLVSALNAARAKAGKGPVQWMVNPNDFYVREAKALLTNDVTAKDAADDFMRETVNFTRRPVIGQYQTVTSLDQVRWPEDVLSQAKPQVLFFVGVQREVGEAWAHYVVLIIVVGAAAGIQA